MSAPIALREDFEARDLRRLAKASKDADQSRRLLALVVSTAEQKWATEAA